MPGFEVLLAGRTLGERYRVDAVVGRGGMGAVFRATDLRLDRAVAVKVVTVEDDAEGRARARFLREAQAAARIRHPHVVGVYDFGTDATLGLDFLVMELLEGEDLSRRLARDTVLAPDEAATVFRQAAEGLAAGHRMGLVHRDVKPGNVFLVSGRATHAMLLDYGVAQMEMDDTETRTHLTRMGKQPLSPAYASPEQIRGEGALTPASDVFSLGITMYRAATGAPPYTATELERMAAGADVPMVPPRERVPELDPAMAAALEHALQPDPLARPADADALLALMHGGDAPPVRRPAFVPTAVAAPTVAMPVAPPPPLPATPPPPAPRPARVGRAVAIGGMLALVGGAVVYGVGGMGGGDPSPAAPDSAAVARTDSAPSDSVQVDTQQTTLVEPDSEPPPPFTDTAAAVEEPPTEPADENPVYDVGSLDETPELRNRRDVERSAQRSYPRFLRDAGVSGDVIVSFVIGQDGNVEPGSIQVVNDVNPAFADAAREVAVRMRFTPGRIRGEPVRAQAQVPINFRAED
ncbi:MAG TPA: TonB family protein [Longimicrobium sp.]|jgi:serine/threonine-protein kinase